jgi:hypothetical protein
VRERSESVDVPLVSVGEVIGGFAGSHDLLKLGEQVLRTPNPNGAAADEASQ